MSTPLSPSAPTLAQRIRQLLGDIDLHALPVERAQAFITHWLAADAGSASSEGAETCPLNQACGRTLALAFQATQDVPPHDNSAMDGWAFNSALIDSLGTQATRIPLHPHVALAGTPALPADEQTAHSAVRIMTGAPMPQGMDTVVPLELATTVEGELHIAPGTCKAGDHRRLRGEDLRQGQVVLDAGRCLEPADIGLLASQGCASVTVRRRLRVACLSTGHELREPGQALAPGQIYDSNRFTLGAMLSRYPGIQFVERTGVPDDPDALAQALLAAAQDADLVLATGGASAGDADFGMSALSRIGDGLDLRLAMRPGRPLTLGEIHATSGRQVPFLGLPGNPVAAMVSFWCFGQAALAALQGGQKRQLSLHLPLSKALSKRKGRTEFHRGQIQIRADGFSQAHPMPHQGSGVLSHMASADGLLVLAPDRDRYEAGESVEFWPFHGLY